MKIATFGFVFVGLLAALYHGVASADSESDALSLTSTETTKSRLAGGTKIFFETALGVASQRYQVGSESLVRGSFDLSITKRLDNGLQFALSDRLDLIDSRAVGLSKTVNSLREAYLSWQSNGGSSIVEFGRINLRYGPGYGYNPTDFFRDGTLRALTTADPFALRENRLGSVMVRGQTLWNGGSLSIAYSPKLDNLPSQQAWDLDLGSTNNRDRALLALTTQISSKVSSQLFLYKEAQRATAVGANLTALMSDAMTAHMEWSHGRQSDLLTALAALPVTVVESSRFVGGVTYTTASKLSLTAEYHYNGFGLDKARWNTLSTQPLLRAAFLSESLRLQDLAPNRAVLLYVTQKNFLIDDLNLTGYVRANLVDGSKLYWIELRRQWANFDLAIQLQQNRGSSGSEFGVLPDRRIIQVLGTYYF